MYIQTYARCAFVQVVNKHSTLAARDRGTLTGAGQPLSIGTEFHGGDEVDVPA